MAHILEDSLELVVSVYTDCSVWEITNAQVVKDIFRAQTAPS